MRSQSYFQNILVFLVMSIVCCSFAGCGNTRNSQSPQEESEGYYWYEAIFLQTEDVEKAFKTVSDQFPLYKYVPDDFHVTTKYKPETKHENLYGTAVTVHITGYVSGMVHDTEEDFVSENEGLLVEVSSTNEEMQALIDSIERTWHITGSYSGAAKYTNYLDFSSAVPMDITIKGVFGMADSEGNVILEADSLGTIS